MGSARQTAHEAKRPTGETTTVKLGEKTKQKKQNKKKPNAINQARAPPVLKAEHRVNPLNKVKAAIDLIHNLVRPAEYVRVILQHWGIG